jgi:hypothetical protein
MIQTSNTASLMSMLDEKIDRETLRGLRQNGMQLLYWKYDISAEFCGDPTLNVEPCKTEETVIKDNAKPYLAELG